MKNKNSFIDNMTKAFVCFLQRPFTRFAPQRIHKLIKEKALHGITVRAVQYISKSEFIAYISLTTQIASVKNDIYKSDGNI